MKRRSFVFALPSLVAARQAIAMTDLNSGRLGICTFSCHRHWEAVRKHETGIRFQDVPSFYDYIHELGADGMQTSVRGMDLPDVRTLRRQMEMDGSYFEGDIRLPKSKAELSDFEKEVQITKEAGASVARAVLTGGRRYEVFHSIAEFQQFHFEARERLGLVEPILKKFGLKLAIENHKDLTIEEHATLMRQIDSEWIGSLVDTGNNIALLDDPYRCIDLLAPFAISVHLKDMAVQMDEDGFLLSEVPCGTGFLDLRRIAKVLLKANPNIVFNLEMATRDPLKIPCLTEAYWRTFPDRRATHLEAALQQVKANPLKKPQPTVTGKSMLQQIALEESNNRVSLQWMHEQLQ